MSTPEQGRDVWDRLRHWPRDASPSPPVPPEWAAPVRKILDEFVDDREAFEFALAALAEAEGALAEQTLLAETRKQSRRMYRERAEAAEERVAALQAALAYIAESPACPNGLHEVASDALSPGGADE